MGKRKLMADISKSDVESGTLFFFLFKKEEKHQFYFLGPI